MRETPIILFLLLLAFSAFGQEYSVNDRRAIKLYQEGEELVLRRRYGEAMEKYRAAIRRNENFLEPYKKLSQMLLSNGETEESQILAQIGAERSKGNVEFESAFAWVIINACLKSGKFEEAIERNKAAQTVFSNTLRESSHFKKVSKQLAFIEEELKDPKPVIKEKLEPPLNSYRLQYFPVLTADSKKLLFTKRDGVERLDHEDIFVSYWQEGQWSSPEPLAETINTINNEGTCSISADGNILIYTSCDTPDTYGSCDLYIAYKEDGAWKQPENMGDKVNSRFWDSQPSLSADGSILFFSSNRRGGYGGNDIWYSMRLKDGSWSEAVNVGDVINTPADEVSPFIYFNNELLFFASDGHMGFGGMDIFTSKIVDGAFEAPKNIGYPINDHQDQLALFITAHRDYAYYTENSLKNGQLDRSFLYRFPFPKEIDLGERLVVTGGEVINERTGEPVAATLSLVNLENDSTMYRFKSDGETGEFMMIYPDKKTLSGLYVEKEGYLPKIFNVEKDSLKDIHNIKVRLSPVGKGGQFVFENVFFDFDKAELRPESMSSLVRLNEFLNANASVDVVIEGHTDSVGDKGYNRDLSLRRAESVKYYLLENGVASHRMEVKGYGDERPLVPNNSAANRAVNRRIEIVIQ